MAASDRTALERLVAQTCATSRFSEVAAHALRMAFERPTPEWQAIVVERADAVVGFVAFGEVAGSIGTSRLHFIAVTANERSHGVGTRLCQAAVDRLVRQGARSIVAEFPGDAQFACGQALLTRCGFARVATVSDYYSDGMDMLIFERSTRQREADGEPHVALAPPSASHPDAPG